MVLYSYCFVYIVYIVYVKPYKFNVSLASDKTPKRVSN